MIAKIATDDIAEMATIEPDVAYVAKPPIALGNGLVKLRPYQEDAVVMVKNSLACGNKRVVLLLATGGGKSAICESIISGALAKGKRVLFLVNRVQLADQMSSHLSRARILHGVIQGSNTRGTYHPAIIGSIDTIHKRGYPAVNLILADECHAAAGSEKYQKLFEHYKNIPIIGVTATAMARGLGREYPWGKLFQDIVCPITIPELIEQGYLVDVDIYAPSEPDLSKVRVVAGEYEEKSLAVASDKPKLISDIVEQWQKRANGKQTIAFAVDIAHSKHIVDQFVKAGVAAEHVDYRMTYEEKIDIFRRFKNCEFTLLSNCVLISEGADFPAAECLIYARATKSLQRYIQICGRVLRPYQGKDRAIILDHSGTSKILGYPTEEQPVHLCDGKPKKSSGSDKKQEEHLPEKCTACDYLKPARVHKCPKCGFAPERQSTVETEDGELSKLARAGKKKTNALAELPKQDVYSQILSIKNARGYSDGWASHLYREIYLVWPRGLKNDCAEPSQELLNFVKAKLSRYSKGKMKGEGHANS